MSRIVVTGATSTVGYYLISELERAGNEVFAIVRPSSKRSSFLKEKTLARPVMAEMWDTDSWQRQIDHAELFFHLGWDGVGAEGRADMAIQRKNAEDALKCMRASKAIGCSGFVFAGSQAEYGKIDGKITEQTPCEPIINYGKGKLKVCREGLELAEKIGIKYCHTRIFSAYGTYDHPWTLVTSCIRTLCSGGKMELSSCEQLWNFMHFNDLGKALYALAKCGATGVYNVAGRDTRQLKNFVEDIYDACGKRGELLFGAYTPREKVVGLDPDTTKLENTIGILPQVDFKTGIENMVRLYEEKGEL